ncbi:MAG: SH3 domain-containing protein [Flavobacteriales bacterium]
MIKRTILLLCSSAFLLACGGGSTSESATDKRIEELEQKVKEQDQNLKEQELTAKAQEIEQKAEELAAKEEDLKKSASNKKYLAEINDPDGYTNVRNGMSTNAPIIDRLYEGQVYEVFPTADANWWKVMTPSNVEGYIHKSRVRLLN